MSPNANTLATASTIVYATVCQLGRMESAITPNVSGTAAMPGSSASACAIVTPGRRRACECRTARRARRPRARERPRRPRCARWRVWWLAMADCTCTPHSTVMNRNGQARRHSGLDALDSGVSSRSLLRNLESRCRTWPLHGGNPWQEIVRQHDRRSPGGSVRPQLDWALAGNEHRKSGGRRG